MQSDFSEPRLYYRKHWFWFLSWLLNDSISIKTNTEDYKMWSSW
jgi:hypothetical protein